MKKVIIDYEQKTIQDYKGFYCVTGYSKVFGFSISLNSLLHYQNGKHLTHEDEEKINALYYEIFVREGKRLYE